MLVMALTYFAAGIPSIIQGLTAGGDFFSHGSRLFSPVDACGRTIETIVIRTSIGHGQEQERSLIQMLLAHVAIG
jgi:hypothetical protein